MRGSGLSSWLTPHPCQAYTRWCSHTFASAETSIEAWGSHMDRLVLLWIRTAPSLYLLVSICTMTGFDLSCQGSIEEGLADPGFEMLEHRVCRGIPIPLSKLFSQAHCFGR